MTLKSHSLFDLPSSILLILSALLIVTSIVWFGSAIASRVTTNFHNDVDQLKRHINPIVLDNGDQKIAVSPELQGRILIASAKSLEDESIGWINREYINSEHTEEHENIGGGADRLWFGPDGGQFSVFFDPGVETEPKNIRVPPALAKQAFSVTSQTRNEVTLENQLSFSNHLGFTFDVAATRVVTLFEHENVESQLKIKIPKDVAWVGYGSNTRIQNIGETAWQTETGLFSIWSLSTFAPKATVVVPLKKPLAKITNYFIPPSDRQTRISEKAVFYNADANFMNKVGIPPDHTLPVIGSYDEQRKLLTIIKFQISDLGSGYTNAVWDWEADPLAGEIINIFNDGIQENGKPFGPFYEMETSSAALALNPGQSHSHFHHTFHFSGNEADLSLLSESILGVALDEIKNAFD